MGYKTSAEKSDLTVSPIALASALALASDEIREQFKPPANTLFLHAKQMEVFNNRCRFKVVVAGRRWGKCLWSESLVSMANGSQKTIDKMRPGDRVLTVNEKTSRLEPRKVLAVEDNGIKETVVLKTASRMLRSTPHHPILTDKGWILAGKLQPGSLVAVPRALPSGMEKIPGCTELEWEAVTLVEAAEPAQTWDLSIDGNHNFIANGIVVHNTQLAKICLIKFARKPRRLIWYVAPSYRMAKQIMWPDLVESIPRAWVRKYNETILTITLVNGSRIELKGADNPDTLRGVGIHYLVMDEVQDISPDAWTKVLRPTLASTGGHAMFIGTPKSYNVLFDLWSTGQRESAKAWASWQFPTITSPFIQEEEIEAARNDMDEKSFEQEFNASFMTMSGRVYYPFDRKIHVKPLAFDVSLPIWIGQDFNIDPMSSVVFQRQKDGEMWAVDEIYLPNSNTQELCDELERRYWRNLDQIVIYPDPAGAYGSTKGRGESDLDIFRERGFRKQKFRRKHPAVADRVNAVNRLLRSASGAVRMYVDPRCKKLIEAFEQTLYVPGSREVDKKASVEHAADAAGYCIEFEFPVRKIEIMGVSI